MAKDINSTYLARYTVVKHHEHGYIKLQSSFDILKLALAPIDLDNLEGLYPHTQKQQRPLWRTNNPAGH